MRLGILCIELAGIWLIYYLFGLLTSHDIPIWATALLVVIVDRTTNFITDVALSRRKRLSD